MSILIKIIAGESIHPTINLLDGSTGDKIVKDDLVATIEVYKNSEPLSIDYTISTFQTGIGFVATIPSAATTALAGNYKLVFAVSNAELTGKTILDLFVQTV